MVQSIELITWDASERVARYAFHYAQASGRKRVTAVHKANIMYGFSGDIFQSRLTNATVFCRKMSDGMFLSACRQVAKDFPGISYDEDLLDRVCLQVWLPFGCMRRMADRRALDCPKPPAILGSRYGHAQPLR